MVLIYFCSRGINIDRQEGISHRAGASQWCKLKPGVAGGQRWSESTTGESPR
jgi:hypothetical protein